MISSIYNKFPENIITKILLTLAPLTIFYCQAANYNNKSFTLCFLTAYNFKLKYYYETLSIHKMKYFMKKSDIYLTDICLFCFYIINTLLIIFYFIFTNLSILYMSK